MFRTKNKQLFSIFFALLLIVFVSLHATARTYWDSDKFMDIDELRPGMRGTGRTVIKGTSVIEFPVEIVDVIPDPLGDLILIRFTDERNPISGLASGMSGSPIFAGGRLIGAIGYGWSLSDSRLALVTPIKRMLELWEWEYPLQDGYPEEGLRETELINPVASGEHLYKKFVFHFNETDLEEYLAAGDTLHAFPAQTPLFVSGFSGRALEKLQQDLSRLGIKALKGGSNPGFEGEISIEPGSAVAIQLVRGDVNMAAIGTVTYREGNRILALGHPFLNRGDVNLLLAGAYIHTVVPSLEMPFKLGSPLGLIGKINQDRTAGVSGLLDQYPKIIPVRIKVNNLSTGKSDQLGFQMVREEEMIIPLAVNSALQLLDSSLQHRGYGSARTKLSVVGSNLPGHSIIRDNFFYSSSDIAAAVLQDLYEFLQLAIYNPFAPIEILNIDFTVEIEKDHLVALVEELEIIDEKEEYSPGDRIDFRVKVRPWRKEPFFKELSVTIPEDFPGGQATLMVTGGSEFYTVPQEDQQSEENLNVIDLGSLEELFNKFVEAEKNNQLVVELVPPYSEENYSQDGQENKKEVKELVDFEYVMEGMLSYQLNIKGQMKEETGPKQP